MLAGVAGLIAVSTTNLLGPSKRSKADAVSTEPAPLTYRDGHTKLLPDFRIVALFGAPYAGSRLGDLGVGTPTQAAERLRTTVGPAYETSTRPVMPAMELIATIAHDVPSANGLYSSRTSDESIDDYLSAARQAGAILILDIQPGHSKWMDEVRAYRKYLEMPDVSLALDPEWSLPKGVVPGKQIGTITAAEINQVSAYLQKIVDAKNLPQKVLIVHQFKDYQLKDKPKVIQRPGVAVAFNIDGFGTPDQKRATYDVITGQDGGKKFFHGFKLFYQEDVEYGGVVMTPAEALALQPEPDIITYE